MRRRGGLGIISSLGSFSNHAGVRHSAEPKRTVVCGICQKEFLPLLCERNNDDPALAEEYAVGTSER
jgi:hypothetical protein